MHKNSLERSAGPLINA